MFVLFFQLWLEVSHRSRWKHCITYIWSSDRWMFWNWIKSFPHEPINVYIDLKDFIVTEKKKSLHASLHACISLTSTHPKHTLLHANQMEYVKKNKGWRVLTQILKAQLSDLPGLPIIISEPSPITFPHLCLLLSVSTHLPSLPPSSSPTIPVFITLYFCLSAHLFISPPF